MKPTLRQLEYLIAIAETGTFSEAAKRTHVSQPSLSIQVKEMENFLGTALLERGRHGALLTPIGEEMVTRARIILRNVEELKVIVRESHGTLAGQLRLGVLPTIGPYFLPQVTRELHAAFPELRLSVREERTLDLQHHLVDGRFDVIISTAEDHPNTNSLPILQENVYICVAPDDPLATSRDPVNLSALKNREFLTLGYGHKFTTLVQNLASLAGATPSDDYEGTSLDAIRQMASMGGPIAILPSLYAISEAKRDPHLIVRQINHPLAQRSISLVWRQSSPLKRKFEKIGDVFVRVGTSIMNQKGNAFR